MATRLRGEGWVEDEHGDFLVAYEDGTPIIRDGSADCVADPTRLGDIVEALVKQRTELRAALIACATMLFEHGGHRVDPFVARFYVAAGVPVGKRDVEDLGRAWLAKAHEEIRGNMGTLPPSGPVEQLRAALKEALELLEINGRRDSSENARIAELWKLVGE